MYYKKRKHLPYYSIVKKHLSKLPGDSLLDVGSWDTDIILSGSFTTRATINLQPVPPLPNVTQYTTDFLSWPAEHFDVVTCLQVLEHLTDEQLHPFISKLFSISTSLIISVPYQWKHNQEKTHKQDPINIRKFISWIPLKPTFQTITNPPNPRTRRLISVYENHPQLPLHGLASCVSNSTSTPSSQ